MMINMTLFKKNIKSHYKLVLIFMAVLTLYFTIIAGMYDPNDLGIIDMLASMKLSPELLAAMGFTLTDTSLLGFLGSYFYGLLMLAFPMICYIILGNKLVSDLVDRGSMAYLLATPNTRRKIVMTQAVFLISTITVIVGFVTVLGIAFCSIQFPDLLDVGKFLMLNAGVLLLHLAISGICFLASCVFNESRNAVMVGAGLPIAFLLIQMLSNSGESLEYLKYFTIFTLFNAQNIISGENFVIPITILAVVGLILYGAAVKIFEKRDLSI